MSKSIPEDTVGQSPELTTFAQYNPDPVLELSSQGQLLFQNAAAIGLAESMDLASIEALLPEETETVVKNCLASGTRQEDVLSTRQGRQFSWSFSPVPTKGTVYCFLRETTERQKLEEQLRHSQNLESMGRLAAGVAHDFSNILTVIQGHLGLMKASPDTNPVLRDSLQQVTLAVERAGKLTSQLQVFSRKKSMNPKPVDLNEVLTHISMMLHRTLGEDIDYQFSYAPDLPEIFADAGMLEQLVMILAVNARDAMPRGGQLIISTSRSMIDDAHQEHYPQARPGEYICLSVVDSGCGMDHVTLGRLFEPFFTTKEFGKGTGLGLAVVDDIVKQHHGWIEVQSVVGQGTTFRLYFPPCTTDQVSESRTLTGKSIPGGTETVLVVEDEPPVRWIVRNVLEQYGYRVLEAGNGVEALAVWHQNLDDIALVVTDLVMPVGLSGQELAEKFLDQKPGTRVIYTSGYSLDAAATDLTLTDGLDYLKKPFDADKLAWAVRHCLDR